MQFNAPIGVSFLIPAYNEAATILDVLERVVALELDVEIIVVDDGSTDDTAARARAAKADQVLVLPVNRGKGAAVRTGVMAARGRTIAFTDADLAYAPDQILGLLERVEAGWDVVAGSRRHDQTTTLVRARRLREIGGRVINFLTHTVLLGAYRDTQCGLKAFRSDVARSLFGRARIDGFAFDVEIFHLVERNRLSLKEVPVALANSETSTVHVGIDALRMVRDLVRIRWLGSRGVYDRVAPQTGPDDAPARLTTG